MEKTNYISTATKKVANTLLSLKKKESPPKFFSSKDATIALLLYRRLNVNDENDGRDYEVKIICSFNIWKTRMALVHFVGYSTDYDRIIPTSKLRNNIS